MRTSLLSCAALAAVATLVPTRAHADVSKAWAAAKDNLPSNTRAVLSVDVAAAVKSPTFAKVLAAVLAKEPEFREGLAVLKSACKIDLVAAVNGVVVAGDPENDKGVVYL
ncbi:MAG: hypothetical protein H0T79_03065, partial [Deltaproteobacteria bacterium]|nr:hypothetical protein [Deltaproteobacteria bacterium]